MAQWYFDEFGSEVGPVTPEEMRRHVADGTIIASTRVRREDGDWTTADRIPGLLQATPVVEPRSQGDTTGGIIPYKNAPALIAYYLAVFSLIPCFGLPLGIAAVVLGIMGLKRRKQNPAISGTAHAWIGIVLGGLMALVWGSVIGVAVIAPAFTK